MRLFFFFGVLLGVLLTFYGVLFFAAYEPGIALVINPNVISLLKDVVGPVAAGFGGAIAGAYAAYLLQDAKEKNRVVREGAGALYRGRLVFIQCLTELASLKKYQFYPVRDEPLRFLSINMLPASPGVDGGVSDRFIDVLVELGTGSVLDEVLLAGARYKACYENFSRRNSSIDEYRRIIENSELGKMEVLDIKQMVGVVGAPRLMAMYRNTEELIVVLDEAIETLKRSLDLTSDLLAKSFDGEAVPNLDFEVLDEYVKYLKPLPAPQLDEAQMYSLLYKGEVAGMASAR